MTYPEFVQKLIKRFGNNAGTLMALRAEVGFLRKYLENKEGDYFISEQATMI